jgi:hypothetical protein
VAVGLIMDSAAIVESKEGPLLMLTSLITFGNATNSTSVRRMHLPGDEMRCAFIDTNPTDEPITT